MHSTAVLCGAALGSLTNIFQYLQYFMSQVNSEILQTALIAGMASNLMQFNCINLVVLIEVNTRFNSITHHGKHFNF